MKKNSFIVVLVSTVLLAAGCATGGSATRAKLTSCQHGHAASQAALGEANARNAELEAQIGGKNRDSALAQKRLEAYRKLADQFGKAFASGNLKIILRNGRLVVQLPNAILYDLGKGQLKPEGVKIVETLATVLKTIPNRNFLIAGHTDNVPVKKRSQVFTSNWQLSALRALGVVLLLQERGVSPKQLAVVGYGEFMPLADNGTEEGREQNRRTEIIIMPTLDEIPHLPATP